MKVVSEKNLVMFIEKFSPEMSLIFVKNIYIPKSPEIKSSNQILSSVSLDLMQNFRNLIRKRCLRQLPEIPKTFSG